jgi:hypothetical protein
VAALHSEGHGIASDTIVRQMKTIGSIGNKTPRRCASADILGAATCEHLNAQNVHIW